MNKFTKSTKKVVMFIWHFVKSFLIGVGEGFFITKLASNAKTVKGKSIITLLGCAVSVPINYKISCYETDLLFDRLDKLDDEEDEEE